MTLKSAMSSIGNVVLSGTFIVHNASIQSELYKLDTQIDELAAQMTELQAKKTVLLGRLIQPR